MRILTRYVLREYLVPLCYCLTGFMSIYILFELFGSFSRLAAARPEWGKVVRYFVGYLAPYFEWLAPACLMLATLYTMWNFCRHSELVAMRASGIGFFAIVRPLLMVATLMAAFVVYVNEVYVPANAQWASQFRNARFNDEEMVHAGNIVYCNPAEDRTWNVGLMVTDDAKVLEDVTVSVDYPSGGRKMTVKSDRAEYLDGLWWFLHPTVFYFDEQGVEKASPVPELEKLSLRAFPSFTEEPRDFILQNRDSQYFSIADMLRFMRTHSSMTAKDRSKMQYDMWAQIASPLACIVITLFAIPAGIATGRQSVFKGIVGALAMFFSFYALTIAFMVLSRLGWCPPILAAFLPDVVFFLIGCRLFWRQR
ncbi:MAG: LptF/LptG family permease [Kiritimatiellae bacterium]|nr:LptF/LptG family permease [Kiritimatiellia bacterium]